MDFQGDVDKVFVTCLLFWEACGSVATGKVLTRIVTSTLGPRARNSAMTPRRVCDTFAKDLAGKEHGPFWSPGKPQVCERRAMECPKEIWAARRALFFLHDEGADNPRGHRR